MEMPKPTAEHARLERLAGSWEGEEMMQPSQWDPHGGTAIGRMTSRVELNGFALISDYQQLRGDAVTFAGHSVMTFDAKAGTYLLHWFDCMGSPAEVFAGRFTGDVLSVAHGGPGMHARLTYDVTDPSLLLTKMEMSQDGVRWGTLFDGRYRRT